MLYNGGMIKYLATDLDNTLVYLDGGHEKYFKFLERYSVPRETACESYEATKCEEGFSMKNLIARVEKMTGVKMDKERVIADFDSWLSNRLKVYPDVSDFLALVSARGIPFSIVSTGEPEFQNEKVKMAGLKPLEIRVVSRVGEKPKVLKEMLAKSPGQVMYIDDKASELDAIRKVFSEDDVVTVRIKRADSPYKDDVGEYKHREIKSLAEIEI